MMLSAIVSTDRGRIGCELYFAGWASTFAVPSGPRLVHYTTRQRVSKIDQQEI